MHRLTGIGISGDLGKLFDRQGWSFHLDLATKYGPIVKFAGLLGVGAYSNCAEALNAWFLSDYSVETDTIYCRLQGSAEHPGQRRRCV